MATETDVDQPAIEQFQEILRGSLIQPDDPSYDEERKIYNAMIDKPLRLIARCANVADVVAAVNFGREHGFDTAIRSSGHNDPGLALVADGFVSREDGATHGRITGSTMERTVLEIGQ